MATANCGRLARRNEKCFSQMKKLEKSHYAQVNYFQDDIA